MKKVLLSVVMVLLLTVMVGCDGKSTKFVVDKVDSNTIYLKKDNTIEAATVEEFKKENYNLDELKLFIQTELDGYNQQVNRDAIVIDELKLKDGNAILVLKYNEITDYEGFNDKVLGVYSTEEIKNVEFNTPSAYLDKENNTYIDASVALDNDEYKVLVLEENVDVILDGTVMYYENAVLVSKNHVQTQSDGTSFIIYKQK